MQRTLNPLGSLYDRVSHGHPLPDMLPCSHIHAHARAPTCSIAALWASAPTTFGKTFLNCAGTVGAQPADIAKSLAEAAGWPL